MSKPQTTNDSFEKMIAMLYVKQGKPWLDHLFQGGLVDKAIRITYDPKTNEVETEVVNVR